jgi:Flp pilus assembly protein TadG
MSHKYSNPVWWRLGRAGVTSLELGIVALLFLMVLIGCMDLGRYYLTEHSLRTIVAEAARARLVGAIPNGTISGPTTDSFAAIAPFVNNANLISLTVTQSPSFLLGVTTITVTGDYQFTAWSPIWSSLNGTISEQTVIWY